MLFRKRISLAIAGCVAVVGIWLCTRDDASEQRVVKSPVRPHATAHRALSMSQLYAEARDKVDGVPGGQAVGTSEPTLDAALAELLSTEPELRAFYDLRRKALRTSDEQQAYLALVSDPRLIDGAGADLLSGTARTDFDQQDELRRLQRIEFLNSALAWADNPARERAVQAVSAVLTAEIPRGAPSDVKGSLLGDKFDLFQLLITSDPDRAEALLAKARGTPAEKVLQFAWNATPRAAAKPAP